MSSFESIDSTRGADVEVAIVGSGFSGLCMGVKLKQRGIENFVILEKDAVFGGTWRVNDYPGAACDIPSHLYSFSFAQNANWSRKFPLQSELLAYTESVVKNFGLSSHIRLNTPLAGAEFDESKGLWRVRAGGDAFTARSLVIATGALSRPVIPVIEGLESFRGKVFHSARWDHQYDLTGKRVVVIGTGASAIQFVPELAKKVTHLDLFQRTPPWVIPRPDRALGTTQKWLLRRVKPYQLLCRCFIYVQHEMRLVAFAKAPMLMTLLQHKVLRSIRRQFRHDTTLLKKVTPDYAMGCKRILLSSDYYPTLKRDNVDVHTDGIREVRPHSIVANNGAELAVDVIIFGTGFDVEHSLGKIEVRGRNGCLLSRAVEGGLEAYKGSTVAGFPNFFMITGPNTGLGHNSMIYMIESGVHYLVQMIRAIRSQNLHSVEVKPQVQADYNRMIQRRLFGTVWSSGCKSWYLTKSGKNNTLWPGFTFEYRWITRRFDAANYRVDRLPPEASESRT